MNPDDQSYFDHVLKTGKPLRDLRPEFVSWEAVLESYAAAQSQNYSAERAEREYEGDESAPPELKITITWTAMVYKTNWMIWSLIISLFSMVLGFTVEKSLTVSFTSHHRISPKCYRSIKTRQAIFNIFNPLFFGVMILLIFLIVPLVVFAAYLSWQAGAMGMILFAVAFVLVSILLLGLIRILATIPNLILPSKLRKIGRRPFTVSGFDLVYE